MQNVVCSQLHCVRPRLNPDIRQPPFVLSLYVSKQLLCCNVISTLETDYYIKGLAERGGNITLSTLTSPISHLTAHSALLSVNLLCSMVVI